ncbi:MAG: hypothetical protein ACP5T0_12190 [Verrucomicrobiia bacterium]
MKTINSAFLVAVIVYCAISHFQINAEDTADCKIDFRYKPPNWQTAICLPDDWQKTLVGKDGALLYDYPGGFSGFGLRINTSLSTNAVWIDQSLYSPKVPIARTYYKYGDLQIEQTAFAVVSSPETPVKKALIERVDSQSMIKNWANPTADFDKDFRHIAVGWGKPVHYRFKSEKDTKYIVAFGLCEGWHTNAGKRILDLQIEGKTRATVDLVKEKGQNIPAVYQFIASDENNDGWIDIVSAASKSGTDSNAILNIIWIFPENARVSEKELLSERYSAQPIIRVSCAESDFGNKPLRTDVMIIKYQNQGVTQARFTPEIAVDYDEPIIRIENSKRKLFINSRTRMFLTADCAEIVNKPNRSIIKMNEVALPAGKEYELAIGILRGEGKKEMPESVSEAKSLLNRAVKFWENLKLPYNIIEVPDEQWQALLTSCIRNIYQAREIKNGLPAFQVGPTCYRGLWVVDGSFIMEAITFLGRTNEAREGIKYLMSFQRDDGGIMLINGHWKETGIALWAIYRHAVLTGDKKWLEQNWSKVEKAVNYIFKLREMPSPDAPNAGLIPDGFSDGGLGESLPEYTNIYWTLAGWKAAIDAANFLGKPDIAAQWKDEYDKFYNRFRKAAERDMKTDAFGNKYLPIRMKNNEKIPPQKAQWAFLHAVFPGKVFQKDDQLVIGNMAMLKSCENQGMVLDTGWLKDGIWTYFGSFYGHSWLWLGESQKAAQTLISFANHASPLMCWREEQMPVGKGHTVVGDMPHNWASAEFIRLTRNCLVFERDEELHLLEGFLKCWLKPGKTLRINNVLTEFGTLSFEMQISKDGKTCKVHLNPPKRKPPNRIVLHLEPWSGNRGVVECNLNKTSKFEIKLKE